MQVDGLGSLPFPCPRLPVRLGHSSQAHPPAGSDSPAVVLGSLHVPQRTHPFKKEAPGQHSGVAEAEVW